MNLESYLEAKGLSDREIGRAVSRIAPVPQERPKPIYSGDRVSAQLGDRAASGYVTARPTSNSFLVVFDDGHVQTVQRSQIIAKL